VTVPIDQRMLIQLLAPIAKLFDFRFGLLTCIAVPLLHFPHEFIALSVNHIEIVVRQLSPLLLHFAFKLLPVALDPNSWPCLP
jgi:hypothetical protein